ncbi:MAG: helix-turn-helix domain-containing protein [Planctomycetes bacterium]|nr:helix-turn-helix domain-containing protein [Planctomycetota bacterium]
MDEEAWKARICGRIRELRRQADLSQMDFAAKANLSHHAIGKMERREVFPSLESLIQLSEAHHIPLGDFFAESTKASTRKERVLRDLTSLLRRQDERKLDLAWGLLRFLFSKL